MDLAGFRSALAGNRLFDGRRCREARTPLDAAERHDRRPPPTPTSGSPQRPAKGATPVSTIASHRTDRDACAADLDTDTRRVEPDGVDRLRPLLAAAAMTDLDDHEVWAAILGVGRRVTLELVADGELPTHLTVSHDDAPVLAARTLAAAWRHVTDTPVRRAAR
jgi:hypothetical protein